MTVPVGVLKINQKLAELLGWESVVDVGGMLLGRPPGGAPDSRDQAPVPNWAGCWSEAGPLAMRLGMRISPGPNCGSVYVDHEEFYPDTDGNIEQAAPFAIAVMACRRLDPALNPWRMFERLRGPKESAA